MTIEGRAFAPPLQLHVRATDKWYACGMVDCSYTTVQDRPDLAGPGQPARLRAATLAKCELLDHRAVAASSRGWLMLAQRRADHASKLQQFLDGEVPHIVDAAFGSLREDESHDA